MSGRVFGVGTGPGDPGLLTRRAVEVIGQADAVFYLEADGKPSRALATASDWVPSTAELCPISMPMRPDPSEGQQAYDTAAIAINQRVAAGKLVAVLCEGDPLLYGSFIHLMERLDQKPEIVPGIPSFLAAAAALPLGLVQRSESLSLISGTLTEAALIEKLRAADCAAILKAGRHLLRVRAALNEAGMCDAVIVVEASGAAQQIMPLKDWQEDTLPYFAIILAWKDGKR